eukprot:s119_g35.t1
MDIAMFVVLMNVVLPLSFWTQILKRKKTTILNKSHLGHQIKRGGADEKGTRILRAPDSLDADDPVKCSFWREQCKNWIVLCDEKYDELLKDVENLNTLSDIGDLPPETKELAYKLYSIMASYLRGPALQVVRAFSETRNAFAVWHRLKTLYVPRARPRALAIGQAIMQHPSFNSQRFMMRTCCILMPFLINMNWPVDFTERTVLRCPDKKNFETP